MILSYMKSFKESLKTQSIFNYLSNVYQLQKIMSQTIKHIFSSSTLCTVYIPERIRMWE
jgi:hypothetical protein